MNFGGGGAGSTAHFVTNQKMQQSVSNGQVMNMVGEGVQYVRTLEGGASLQQNTPQLITLPISLPGAKPGDPQQTMQIQVLSPGVLQQGVQQPKYMQIPIQGFNQGGVGAVLTVSYNPDSTEGLQLVNSVNDGVQLVLQQDMQLVQQNDSKEQAAVLIQNSQPIIMDEQENNNNSLKIKQEEEIPDDDNSDMGESISESSSWQIASNQEIAEYLSKMPQQQGLPVSLQQYLKLNPDCVLKREIVVEDGPDQAKPDANENGEEDPLKLKKKKKYKKRPLKPPRPKPGQVQIAQAVDGTPIFCCPECHMAYPEKEQLELHLSVHKIERRFICGICGAGLKRKEHLERHKLGHNPDRPFKCAVCGKGFKRKEHLNLHAVIHSGEKTHVCQECGKGFYRKDHLRKHSRSHQSRRAREDAELSTQPHTQPQPRLEAKTTEMLPEITIHVPTSSNVQVPVQISVPHHIISTLPNGQQQITLNPGHSGHISVEELFSQQS